MSSAKFSTLITPSPLFDDCVRKLSEIICKYSHYYEDPTIPNLDMRINIGTFVGIPPNYSKIQRDIDNTSDQIFTIFEEFVSAIARASQGSKALFDDNINAMFSRQEFETSGKNGFLYSNIDKNELSLFTRVFRMKRCLLYGKTIDELIADYKLTDEEINISDAKYIENFIDPFSTIINRLFVEDFPYQIYKHYEYRTNFMGAEKCYKTNKVKINSMKESFLEKYSKENNVEISKIPINVYRIADMMELTAFFPTGIYDGLIKIERMFQEKSEESSQYVPLYNKQLENIINNAENTEKGINVADMQSVIEIIFTSKSGLLEYAFEVSYPRTFEEDLNDKSLILTRIESYEEIIANRNMDKKKKKEKLDKTQFPFIILSSITKPSITLRIKNQKEVLKNALMEKNLLAQYNILERVCALSPSVYGSEILRQSKLYTLAEELWLTSHYFSNFVNDLIINYGVEKIQENNKKETVPGIVYYPNMYQEFAKKVK